MLLILPIVSTLILSLFYYANLFELNQEVYNYFLNILDYNFKNHNNLYIEIFYILPYLFQKYTNIHFAYFLFFEASMFLYMILLYVQKTILKSKSKEIFILYTFIYISISIIGLKEFWIYILLIPYLIEFTKILNEETYINFNEKSIYITTFLTTYALMIEPIYIITIILAEIVKYFYIKDKFIYLQKLILIIIFLSINILITMLFGNNILNEVFIKHDLIFKFNEYILYVGLASIIMLSYKRKVELVLIMIYLFPIVINNIYTTKTFTILIGIVILYIYNARTDLDKNIKIIGLLYLITLPFISILINYENVYKVNKIIENKEMIKENKYKEYRSFYKKNKALLKN
jgi:hypothetical protein